MSLNLLWSSEFIVFALLAIVTLVSAYQMVVTRLITHAALFMALSFTSVAGIFLLLQAEFVAAIQVLVYAGAITTMVIFAIMLSGLKDIRADQGRPVRHWARSNVFVLVVGAIFGAFMSFIYYTAGLPNGSPSVRLGTPEHFGTVQDIGTALFTTYVVPFELASILLLIAMVGAIILTAKEVDQQ